MACFIGLSFSTISYWVSLPKKEVQKIILHFGEKKKWERGKNE